MMAKKTPLPIDKLCVELPNTRKEGQTGIFRNGRNVDGLMGYDPNECNTFYDIVQLAFKEYPKKDFLGTRKKDENGQYGSYEWETYEQVEKKSNYLANALYHLLTKEHQFNLSDEDQVPIGIYSVNRADWLITDIALNLQSFINVALFDTYGTETLEYVINHSEVPIIVCSIERIAKLLKSAKNLPKLKVIISMDPLPKDNGEGSASNVLRSWAASVGLQLWDFDEMFALGQQNIYPHRPPKPESVYTYCYTSGTTGKPKGAIITHLNNTVLSRAALENTDFDEDDVLIYFSYLPAAHCFERSFYYLYVRLGASIGFYSGDILRLMDDCAALRPTAMNSVPRLLNRIYDRIAAQGLHGQGLGPALFRIALAQKQARYKAGQGVFHPFWDALIFNRIKQVLGGRVKYMVTGSAPISPEVLDFLKLTLCIEIIEGYGATETCAGATVNPRSSNESGSVGAPVPSLEFKLVDVPEMGYYSTDKPFPRGELCLRGSNVFRGYYKDPEKTAEALDEEGWYHSGDIVSLDRFNFPKIIDRKKNIFKLSQGEYISPEKIENVYNTAKQVMQIFVYGSSIESKLVAIVVPDPETFPQWAAQYATSKTPTNISGTLGMKELCNDEKVKEMLLKEFDHLATSAKLSGFEKVFAIHLEPEPFSVDNGLITPTFKLKRHELHLKYKDIIADLYAKLNA